MSGKVRTTWISDDIGPCPEKKVWNSVSGKYRTSLHLFKVWSDVLFYSKLVPMHVCWYCLCYIKIYFYCVIPYSEYWEKNNMVLLKSYEAVTAMAVALSMSDNIWSSRGRELLVDAFTRSRTRQNFELVHIIGPVQNFGPPARNFGPLRAEFAWWEWRKTLGGHVANWAGLSGFSPRENKISHTFFIDCINKYSRVSNAHNCDDCHGVFNGEMLNKGWSFSRSRFDCLGLMHFFHG